LSVFGANAQITVTVTDGGSVTIPCGDPNVLLDGFNGAYTNNTTETITICATAGEGLTVNISMASEVGGYFDIDPSDTLYVYDGLDNNSPLIATLNNTSAPFGAATANTTLSNLTGCMTLVFVTDGSGTGQGFQGEVTCNYSCQPIIPWFSTVPAIEPNDSTGAIKVCLGETVTLNATAQFPMSAANGGPGYNQTLSNSVITWDIFGEATQTGTSVTFTPTQHAGYFVDMLITDTLGCFEYARTRILVSTIPSFASTMVLEGDTICLGEVATLIGGVTTADTVGVDPTEGQFLNGGLFGDALELPDGSGTIDDIYSTTITITGFEAGDTLVQGSDLMTMCISMEHSYLGDLEMWLECPNGYSIVIFNAYNANSGAPGFIPGGFTGSLGTNFGIPGAGSNQGTCWQYCYSVSQNTFGTLGSEFNTNTTNGAVTAGTYLPEQSFDDLVGCPLNGDWTLHVADSWPADDGWICEWGITFDPSIDPNAETYIPLIEDTWWSPNPTFISNQGDTLILSQPSNAGDFFFQFNVLDDFGCTYDTTITLNVVPNLTSFANTSVCALTYDLEAAVYPITGQWSASGPGTITFSPNDTTQSPSVSVSEPGPYSFIYESEYCGQKDTMEVYFRLTPQDVVFNDTIICPGDTLSFDALNVDVGPDYLWTPGGSTGQTFTLENIQQNTTVTVAISNECGDAEGTADITVNLIDIASSIEVCLGTEASLNASNVITGGTWSYDGPGDVTFDPDANADNTNASASVEGNYTFTFTDNYCNRTFDRDVAFAPIPTVDISVDTNRICLEDQLLFIATTNTNFLDEFYWSPNGVDGDSLLVSGSDNSTFISIDPNDSTQARISVTVSNFCGTETENYDFEVIDCTLIIPNVFNPNAGNEDNRTFHIAGLDLHPGNHVIIYDRWGFFTYEADNYHLAEWKGENASDGVYYYIITRSGYEAQTGYVHLVGGAQ